MILGGKAPFQAAAALLCAALATAPRAEAQAQSFALKNGETVVFYGDSITALRFYTRDVEEFALTRYPSLHIRFINAAVPGDTAAGGYAGTMAQRVARDVAPYEPGMITVMLGMNDGGWGYGSPDQIDADFRTRYKALLQALRSAAPGAAFTLISSTPYDEITHGTEFPGYSKMVDRLAGDVAHIAALQQPACGLPASFADFHQPMVDALQRAMASSPQMAALMIPDRIHPAETAHWIMAAILMAAWHVDPVVTSFVLDAAHGKPIESVHTQVSDLRKSADGFQWSQLDEALPLPLDFNNAMTSLLLQISNIAGIDQEMLHVDSLAPGRYELLIDGKNIAAFSSGELQQGINIALYQTPMLDQARDIASIEGQRADLDHARFVLSADVKQMPSSGIAEATLRAAGDDLDAKVREHLQLKPHAFELRLLPAQAASTTAGNR